MRSPKVVPRCTLLPLLLLLLLASLDDASPYSILGVFPHEGLSHFMMFQPLMLELANRGHRVVVLSRFPRADNVPNYVDVDVSTPNQTHISALSFDMFSSVPLSLYQDMRALYQFLLRTEDVYRTENFQKFWKGDDEFDLVVIESFNTRSFYAFAYRFDAPLVAVSSCAPMPWTSYDAANPINPAYIPALLSYNADRMNFAQRLGNACMLAAMSLWYELLFDAKSEQLKRQYLGADIPPLRQLARRASLVLVNTHSALNGPRPLAPAVVQVGGLFVEPNKPLPPNIREFIDDSKEGVVYFCMGSLLRGASFPKEKRDAFLYAFSKLPQRVLWKWEGDELPGKTDNIMISEWMPQRDILAHPNVKLFISHGGLLGTSEAVYEGVPILGIPIFGDQRTNVKAIEANGAGELLDYNDISNQTVLEKIRKILTNPEYQRKADQLSRRYRDRPMSPLDTAVYWTEYVIRHKGAPHLRTAAADMPWYQYLLLDVLAFLAAVLVASLLLLYYATKGAYALLVRLRRRAGRAASASFFSTSPKEKYG